MPDLSDFLGTIIQETARARMSADLESVRIAESYYQDVYLKHLPVPHFKMPELIIEMPVQVKQINPPGSNVTNSTMMSKMHTRVNDDLARYLTAALRTLEQEPELSGKLSLRSLPTRASVTLASMKDALGTKIKASCKTITATVFRDKDYIDVNTTPIRLTELSDALNDMLYRELVTNYKSYFTVKSGQVKGELDESSLRNVLDNVRQLFMESVTFILKENETTLEIEGSTDQLAQASGAGFLTKIKMTIREHDYEWVFTDREDGIGIEKRTLAME